MGIELAEILRQCRPAYRQKFAGHLPIHHLQAMQAIETCRTEVLGGQVYVCPDCEQVQYSYHSCRNRHCPKCQNENAQVWLVQQQATLLPVPYFLLTFTLPAGLREFARHQPRLIYDLLLRMSAEATQKLAQASRFVGGQVGLVGVLHTWGRNLAYHPHVHYLVPAGGLAADGNTWLPARQKFLLPVKALSRIFRAKMRQALRKIDVDGRIPPEVWRQSWVVEKSNPDVANLYQMWVAPSYRRLGAGKMLLDAVIEWARAQNASYLELGVTFGNGPARRLYSRAGFEPVGRPQSLRPGSELLGQTMRLKL